MRILLVTLNEVLPAVLNKILNSDLNYCAIVIDEPEDAKKIVLESGFSKDIIYPLYQLKECLENFYYDYCVCITDRRTVNLITEQFHLHNLPKNKFVHLFELTGNYNFGVEKKLRYYMEHSSEFEIFSTNHMEEPFGLHADDFNLRLLNFGERGQDLYYGYKIAEKIFSEKNNLHHALIGVTPYSFHYNQSVEYDFNYSLLSYFIALNDLHNFHMSETDYKNLFDESYLSQKFGFEGIHSTEKSRESVMMPLEKKIVARDYVEMWNGKICPDIRDENKKILDNYLTLCESKNLKTTIFSPPVSTAFKKHFSNEHLGEFHKIIYEVLDKHSGASFVDGWAMPGFSEDNFYDVEHFNIKGAKKFSKKLNEIIE